MNYTKIILFASLMSASAFSEEVIIDVNPSANTSSVWNTLSDAFASIPNIFGSEEVIVAPEVTEVVVVEVVNPDAANVAANTSSLWNNITDKCAAAKAAVAGNLTNAKDGVVNGYNTVTNSTKKGISASWKATTDAVGATKDMVNNNVAATTAFIKAHPYKVAIASAAVVAAVVVTYQVAKKSCNKTKESKE